ncbi:F-box protein At-B [Lycium ferocissimum]|uniref:F-box protein At-B n=1 Tax=Lycium ferocissimum TaxID=112874 RepID=UPI002814A7AB|nr:F-box protein At-B [Lycium ferocissimum]XP_059283303.1 F-box protein At-B [Lycium ferocissimum]XP_059283305.1 F-box protein At-B [Lycium ferocissimum]XP_059283306.1 F-box protein At-B [Lycium ferocissimum]
MAATTSDINKRHRIEEEEGGGNSNGDFEVSIEKLPEHIISHVLHKLDLESLCTATCVSRTFHSAVTPLVSSLSSIDLSECSLDEVSLRHVVRRVQGAKSLTIDCLQMKSDSSIINILHEHIIDLSLLKCSSLSYDILCAIGERCPNLRSLLIEFSGCEAPELFKSKFTEMLQKISLLESLSIKIRGTFNDVFDLRSLELFLPKSIKNLKLQQADSHSSILWIDKIRDNPWFKLLSLSLVLDVISDDLLIAVVNSLPLLVELDLEDRPRREPSIQSDLTNIGLQSLEVCQHLITLSIVRSQVYLFHTSFKRVDNMGMFLLSEGCGGLESVKLGGFTKVTEAGFSSILHSCQNLKKFEVSNSSLLSDLAFHNMRGVARSLIELRLLSCRLLTSEAMEELSSFSNLEVLDTSGCRSIADPCLYYISSLTTLTKLNLAEADITDKGLAILGRGNSPIAQLCIRGCKRVTDKGIEFLFHGEGKICKTLSMLDVGHMPGISDAAIFTIASAAKALTDLSLRYCFHVTDAAVKMLVDRTSYKCSLLQRLDLYNCRSLSDDSVMLLLHKSSFRGLRWLGVRSLLVNKRDDFSTICNVRPWLVVCFEGCQFGCHDGWQFHDILACLH